MCICDVFSFSSRAVGLVVKYLVANEMPRVRFPDGALSFIAFSRNTHFHACTQLFFHDAIIAYCPKSSPSSLLLDISFCHRARHNTCVVTRHSVLLKTNDACTLPFQYYATRTEHTTVDSSCIKVALCTLSRMVFISSIVCRDLHVILRLVCCTAMPVRLSIFEFAACVVGVYIATIRCCCHSADCVLSSSASVIYFI